MSTLGVRLPLCSGGQTQIIALGPTTIRLEPTILERRCPGEEITLTCTTTGSPILAWRSEEYIGPGDTQLEFPSVDEIGTTKNSTNYPSTVATLTNNTSNGNGSIELTSTLQITLSAEIETSSVTCVNIGTGDMLNASISLLGKKYNYSHNLKLFILLLPNLISIINHTLPSTIRAVIGTPGTSMASNSTSASECY